MERRRDARLDERHKGRVERERLLELVRVLPEEEDAFLDHVHHDEPEHLAQVQARNHLFKELLPGLVGRLVDVQVPLCAREVLLGVRVEAVAGRFMTLAAGPAKLGYTIARRGREKGTHAPHSQLMAISASSGRPRCLILGMFLTFST